MKNEVNDALRYGREALKKSGIESWSLDALVLLSEAAQLGKETIFAHGDYMLTDEQAKKYIRLIKERQKGCPVQYIINKAEFMGINFYVDKNVLIPRADTEILAELTIKTAKMTDAPKVLDLCTGSGCLAISVASFIEKAFVVGVDISEAAAAVAKNNSFLAGVNDRTAFYVSDLFNCLNIFSFDIIVCNPPYIPDKETEALIAQVKDFEPMTALRGGCDGLDFYRRIVKTASKYIKPCGFLLFEVGHNQAESVKGILDSGGFKNIELYKDLSGIDRVVSSIYVEV